jgi:hypothetical protein
MTYKGTRFPQCDDKVFVFVKRARYLYGDSVPLGCDELDSHDGGLRRRLREIDGFILKPAGSQESNHPCDGEG